MPYRDRVKQAAAQKKHYEDNKNKWSERQRSKRNKNRRYIAEVKEAAVCSDCGIDYPPFVLDFDHVRGEKVLNLGRLVNDATLEKVKEEIDKCEIVCSNCHRYRTWRRQVH